MTREPHSQPLISHYIEKFLEEHFGEKPEQVIVTLRPPFLLIHLNGFILPSEKMFVEKGQWNKVLEIRDLLIDSVKADLLTGLQAYSKGKLTNLYADWNLSKRSGMLIATMEKDSLHEEFPWPKRVDEDTLREIILLNSMSTQRIPDQTNFYWLSDQILLIERIGILIDIEKKLVENGITEELRLAKRPLELRITQLFNLESILNGQVLDLFVDWDFQREVSYLVLLLEERKT
ncbi:Na-translocating system protein MpsC family protein [Planococcus sp. 4-30]|uniref:Na-translocating system protein MpsC family protein n=1 Tax=Planococcus TaxID=1372 RepID=UPI001CC080AD|nr:Na-translocating system protein MpsC family protein [Planococcus sp. 4-30]